MNFVSKSPLLVVRDQVIAYRLVQKYSSYNVPSKDKYTPLRELARIARNF